jgi:hypothetical protein
MDLPFGIYTPGLEGASWFDDADTVTLTGSGQGLGGSLPGTDGGRFLFKRLRGDCELVADVPLLSRVELYDEARAGLMIRDSNDSYDRFAAMMRQPGTEPEPARIRFQYRTLRGGNSGSVVPVAGVSQGGTNYLANYDMPMIRMRLVRQGAKLYGYLSTNETETVWYKSHDTDAALNEDVLAGLFVSRSVTVRQALLMTNTFDHVTVRELVTAARNATEDRRVVSWVTDLPDAPEGATFRLSYATSYTGTFTLLADDATPPYETDANWMTGTSLYFRVQYVLPGATNLLGTSGACALRLAQPARAAPATNGLWAAYYSPNNVNIPLAERLEPGIADNWTNAVAGLGATNFMIAFNGSISPTESDLYVFGSEADDTLNVVLNNQVVLADVYANTNGVVSVSSPVWLEAGRTYSLRVDYLQDTADKRALLRWAKRGDDALSTIPTETLTPFPLPWTHMDIGVQDIGGTAEYDGAGGVFTVAGAGTGVAGTSDSFRYAWRERSGDFDFSMRVRTNGMSAAQVTAGLMCRVSAAAGAANAGVYLVEGASSVQVVAQARTTVGGATQTLAAGPTFAKDQALFLRVSRAGYTLTLSCRAEGVSEWTELASTTVVLPDTALIGMAVASQNPEVPAAALFDTLDDVAYTAVELAPVADAYVHNGYADSNYGTATTLQIKRVDDAYTRESFLKFDARGYAPVRSATLKLYVVTNYVPLVNEPVAFRRIVDNTWQESAVTWSNAPAGTPLPSAYLDPQDPLSIGTAMNPGIGQWLELDVTAALNASLSHDGVLSVGISSLVFSMAAFARQLEFASREYATASLRPKLVIVPAAPNAPAVRLGSGGTEAQVTWAAFPDATAYRVWRAADAPAGFTQVSGDLAGLAFTNSGLSAGTTYFFAVSAVTPQGETPLSPPVAVAATTQSSRIVALEDAYVQGGASRTNNFGTTATLMLKNEKFLEADYAREAFMRFDTEGLGGVEQALLSLTVSSTISEAIPKVLDVRLVPDSEWVETAITYANPPAGATLPTAKLTTLPADGTVVRITPSPLTSGTTHLIDVTAMVRAAARTGAGKMTLGLNRYDTDTLVVLSFHSKNATGPNTNLWPKLIFASVRPGVPAAVPAAGGVGLAWPAFRDALSYTVRRAEARDGTYATLATGLTGTVYTAAATSGWFTVSAVTAGGETPPSDVLYAEKSVAYDARLPQADTFVESGGNAAVNYGQTMTLTLKATPMSPTREQFFRFDVAGLERAASVRLRLNVAASSTGFTPSSVLVYDETADEWNENAVTWNTMIPGLTVPRANGAARAANEVARVPYPVLDGGSRISYVEADVTEAVRTAAAEGRQPTFRVCGDSTTAAAAVMWVTASKEVNIPARLPVLLADMGAFGAPTGARVERDEANRAATLVWTAVPGADSYTVRRLLPGGGSEVAASGLTATAWGLSDLSNNGTVYTYEVVAVSADGTVSEAAQVAVTLDRQYVRPITEDTYIRGGVGSNEVHGADTIMTIKRDGDPQYNREGYLRLSVTNLPAFTKVQVRLNVVETNNTDMTVVAQAVADTAWTETGVGALTWDNAPVKLLDNPGLPVAGELGRCSLLGVHAGDTLLLDVTQGLKEWLALNPAAESVVLHLFSANADGGGAKSVNLTSEEGAILPEQTPAMVYTVAPFPLQGTVMMLR